MKLPTILKECSQFLEESNNLPLLKNLLVTNDGFKKIKVRKKNTKEFFTEAFNKSFAFHKQLMNRAVFANGENSFIESINENFEPFYIFPIDGYKFVYNPVVTNALEQYKKVIDDSLKILARKAAIEMFSSVIKQSYLSNDLANGIKIGSEIIIYDIPYYYAIRKSLVDDYSILS